MADFKGLNLNTDLLDFSFNRELTQNQFGTSSFILDQTEGINFTNIFKDEDFSVLSDIQKTFTTEVDAELETDIIQETANGNIGEI